MPTRTHAGSLRQAQGRKTLHLNARAATGLRSTLGEGARRARKLTSHCKQHLSRHRLLRASRQNPHTFPQFLWMRQKHNSTGTRQTLLQVPPQRGNPNTNKPKNSQLYPQKENATEATWSAANTKNPKLQAQRSHAQEAATPQRTLHQLWAPETTALSKTPCGGRTLEPRTAHRVTTRGPGLQGQASRTPGAHGHALRHGSQFHSSFSHTQAQVNT